MMIVDRLYYNLGSMPTDHFSLQDLWTSQKTTDIGALGSRIGIQKRHLPEYIDSEIKRLMVATALELGIGGGQSPTGLALREISPHLDFANVLGGMISTPVWEQPSPDIHNGYDKYDIGEAQPIYYINDETGILNKVLVLYGLIIPQTCNVGEIQLWKTNEKLMDRFLISGKEGRKLFFNTAHFIHSYDKQERWDIRFLFKDREYEHKKDYIQFLGYVCETVGSTTIG